MSMRDAVCWLVMSISIGAAQTQEEIEKRIASLPSDQRVFERFRLWIASLPTAVRGSSGISDQLRDAKLLEKYRVFLKERGSSDADISAQFEVLRQEGNRLEAVRWNRILTAEHPTFNAKSNEFLVEMVK